MKSISIRTTCVAAALAAFALPAVWAVDATPSPSATQHERVQPSGSSNYSRSNLSSKERNFLQSAAEANAAEVRLGQIAERQSSDPNIKKIGQELAQSHQQALQELQQLAASKGISVTTQPTSRQQRMLSSLQEKSGNSFNKQFLKVATATHKRSISLFERAARRSEDPDIKSWANKMLPELENHLAMVQTRNPEAVAEKTGHKSQHGQPQQKASPSPGRMQNY